MDEVINLLLAGSIWRPFERGKDRAVSWSTRKKLGRTPLVSEVFKKTHVKKKENELDLDVWVEERA
ncbi:hypothetical protein H5410_052384 [Solanum commersonii]|uniref:Uncharacterized protein n=1 Tax=Solanum commersonii TaxID=4109 RepID=A0A9J5X2W3_SOLCO|nr:hypothetical protein H5410_052384 [Solanum commersonii]